MVFMKGADDLGFAEQDHSIAVPAGSGVHYPKTVLQLLTVWDMGVTEEKNVGSTVSGIGDGSVIVSLYVPEMTVRK